MVDLSIVFWLVYQAGYPQSESYPHSQKPGNPLLGPLLLQASLRAALHWDADALRQLGFESFSGEVEVGTECFFYHKWSVDSVGQTNLEIHSEKTGDFTRNLGEISSSILDILDTLW